MDDPNKASQMHTNTHFALYLRYIPCSGGSPISSVCPCVPRYIVSFRTASLASLVDMRRGLRRLRCYGISEFSSIYGPCFLFFGSQTQCLVASFGLYGPCLKMERPTRNVVTFTREAAEINQLGVFLYPIWRQTHMYGAGILG